MRLRIAGGNDGANIIGAKLLRIRFIARSATTVAKSGRRIPATGAVSREPPGYDRPEPDSAANQGSSPPRARSCKQPLGSGPKVLRSPVWLFCPPRCILPTTTWLSPKFIVEGLIQQPRNLANHNVLASAPVLTDNRISPPPCCATNRSTKFTTFTGAKMVATTDRPPFELEPAHRGQISHPAGAATSPAATNQQAGTVSCRHR